MQDQDAGFTTLQITSKANHYNQWLYSIMLPYLGKNILEIGCGIGTFTKTLLKNGFVTALDRNKRYLAIVRRTIRSDKLKITLGNIEKVKFPSMKYDSIVCLNVLEHLKNDKKAFSNIFYSLKDGGIFIVLVPAQKSLFGKLDENLGHYRRYDKHTLSRLLTDAGFEIKKIRYVNLLGAIGWFINSRLLRKKSLSSNQIGIFEIISVPFLFLEKIIELPLGLSVFAVAGKPK